MFSWVAFKLSLDCAFLDSVLSWVWIKQQSDQKVHLWIPCRPCGRPLWRAPWNCRQSPVKQFNFNYCSHFVSMSLQVWFLCDVICAIIFTWAMVAVVAALKIMPHSLKPNGTKIMIITSFSWYFWSNKQESGLLSNSWSPKTLLIGLAYCDTLLHIGRWCCWSRLREGY